MARGVFCKRLRTLVAADEDAENLLDRLPNNELVMVEVKRPRNLKHLRLYWGLMQLVFENLPEDLQGQWLVRSKENLSDIAKIAVGHFEYDFVPLDDTLKNFDLRPVPKSISYDAMSQDDFGPFFDKVVDWLLKDVIPGLERDDLLGQVNELLGVRA